MKPVRAMRILSILCLLFACTLDVYAQQFPVQVTPVLAPPYSLYLSDYASPEGNLQLIIQLRELNRPEYRVKLRLTIEGQGIIIRTKGSYVPPALVLQGGVTEILTGNDIRNYFNPDHLDFSGISKSDFIRKGALPEGFYTFKFEAIDYLRNVTVSNTGFANAWIILNDPPIINLPFNEDKVVATDPQNVQFSWTPRHTASPNAAFSTEYEFTMVELYPDNRNPNDAIRVGRPIFVTQTTLTSLNYGITETLLIPGRRYAFRVRAYDTDGRDLFKNGGYSEVVVFQFGDACIPPLGVKAEALDESRLKLTWEESPIHTGYAIQFRKKGSSDWNDETALSTSAIVPGLQPSTTYEYRVSGTCGTIRGEYSALASVTTTESDPTEFSCGVAPPVIDISTTPLQGGLKVLDIIKTADFDVIVTDVEANGDSYTGTGKAMMPWFNLATVNVKFKGIKVNDDYRVYSGNVITVYSKSSRLVLNVDLNNEEKDEDKDGDGIPDDEETDYITPDTVTIPFDIEEITIDTSNPDVIVVVAEDGTTQEIPREKDEDGKYTDTVVKDSNGDTWIVDKDGKVSEGPSAGAPDALASLDDLDYTITFEGIADQQYGLDKKGDDSYGEYETAIIRDEEYVVPWKSVETGRQDRVAAIAGDESTFPSAVGFKISGAEAPVQPSSDASMKEVFVTGKSGGLEESLSAYVMVKESDDDEPQEVEIGKLNIATYDKVRRKVFLVPVNGAQVPEAATVQTELNRIYKQAVVEWDVELAPNFIYDEDVKGIDSDESDFLSSFPGRMQELNRTFANTTWVDANSYYLFFLNGTESRRTGFMPFKRKYGYIYLDRIGTKDTPERVVAHELGHGAFRLRHTFSPEEKKANEGSTDNLMDYNHGSELKKYQWDLIHDPENVNGWLEDDSEAAMGITNGQVCMPQNFIDDDKFFSTDQANEINDAIIRFNKYTKTKLFIYVPGIKLGDEKIFEKSSGWEKCAEKGIFVLLNLKEFLGSGPNQWERNLVIVQSKGELGIKSKKTDSIRSAAILPLFNALTAKDNVSAFTALMASIQHLKDHFKRPGDIYLTIKGSRTKFTNKSVFALNKKAKDTRVEVTLTYKDRTLDPSLLNWNGVVDVSGVKAFLDLTSFTNSKEMLITYDKTDVLQVVAAKYEVEFANAGGTSSDEIHNRYGYDEAGKGRWSESGHHISLKTGGSTNIKLKTDIFANIEIRTKDNSISMTGSPVSLSTNEYRLAITSTSGPGDHILNAYYKGTEDVLAAVDVHVYDEMVLNGSMYVLADNSNGLRSTASLTMSDINTQAVGVLKTIVTDISLNQQTANMPFNLNKNDGLDVVVDALTPADNYEVEAITSGIQALSGSLNPHDALVISCPIYQVGRLRSSAVSGDKRLYIYEPRSVPEGAGYEFTVYDPVTKNSQSGLRRVGGGTTTVATYQVEFSAPLTLAANSTLYQKSKMQIIGSLEKGADRIYLKGDFSSVSLDEDVYAIDAAGKRITLEIKKESDGRVSGEQYKTGNDSESVIYLSKPLEIAQTATSCWLHFYWKLSKPFPLAIPGVQKMSYTSNDFSNMTATDYIANTNGSKTNFTVVNVQFSSAYTCFVEFDQTLSYNFPVRATPSTNPIIIRKYAASATGATQMTGGMSGLGSANGDCLVLVAHGSTSNFGFKYAHELGHKLFHLADVNNSDNIMHCTENTFKSYYKAPFTFSLQQTVKTGRCEEPIEDEKDNQWNKSRGR